MYVSIHICLYVCRYVCVCEREKPIKKEKNKNIIYYTISLIDRICFVTISNIMFIRNFLVSQNVVIWFFIFLKFSLVNLLFFFFISLLWLQIQ